MEIGHNDDDFHEYVDHVFEILDDDIENAYLPMERVVFRDQENPIEALSASEFVQRYHISKDNVINVVLPLFVRNRANRRGLPIPDILKLTTFLRYLSSGSFQVRTFDNFVWYLVEICVDNHF
uniref:Uncharacterized protein n=1 Tax=Cacopsylla melanoneura TaxID=428564 RepID=A0A8D8Z4Q9_9HEMI